ncbi:MAG TPA: hypothetical protein DCE75_08480, partial [Acidimicrobiaceae bacterium]|nr:hypothetical protein [Acidimicrobiaceae bacterium]
MSWVPGGSRRRRRESRDGRRRAPVVPQHRWKKWSRPSCRAAQGTRRCRRWRQGATTPPTARPRRAAPPQGQRRRWRADPGDAPWHSTHGTVTTVRHPFLAYEAPVGFAHRGGAGAHPENTERAFRHAAELGYRYLETDVHATADGVLIAFHDDKLDRVTDRTGRIIDLTWAEVAEARVDGRDPILRFDEMLQRFPEARINIDPKADTAVEPLADLIVRCGVQDRVCVTSFFRRRTERVKRRVGGDLCTG